MGSATCGQITPYHKTCYAELNERPKDPQQPVTVVVYDGTVYDLLVIGEGVLTQAAPRPQASQKPGN